MLSLICFEQLLELMKKGYFLKIRHSLIINNPGKKTAKIANSLLAKHCQERVDLEYIYTGDISSQFWFDLGNPLKR